MAAIPSASPSDTATITSIQNRLLLPRNGISRLPISYAVEYASMAHATRKKSVYYRIIG